eukprot:scaffold67326_cov29-Phaeocystis_antarctica.AAC.1
MTPQGRGPIGWRDSVCPATWLMPNRWHGGWQPAAVPLVGHQPRRSKRTARTATFPRDPGA